MHSIKFRKKNNFGDRDVSGLLFLVYAFTPVVFNEAYWEPGIKPFLVAYKMNTPTVVLFS